MVPGCVALLDPYKVPPSFRTALPLYFRVLIPNFGSPEDSTTSCAGQDFWELQSKNVWGGPRLGTTFLEIPRSVVRLLPHDEPCLFVSLGAQGQLSLSLASCSD